MAEDKPSIQVDSDWKRQAQEEKRRLAEAEDKRRAAAASAAPVPQAGPATATDADSAEDEADVVQSGEASFAGLVQSMMTQILLYLGEIRIRGREPMLNLDAAKHEVDTLGILEEKTQGNLTNEEKQILDTVLFEVRSRFISLASRVAQYPAT